MSFFQKFKSVFLKEMNLSNSLAEESGRLCAKVLKFIPKIFKWCISLLKGCINLFKKIINKEHFNLRVPFFEVCW